MKPGTHTVVLNVWLGSNVIGFLAAVYQLVSDKRDVMTWIMLLGFLVGVVASIAIRGYGRNAG